MISGSQYQYQPQFELPIKEHTGKTIQFNNILINRFRDFSDRELRLWKTLSIRKRGILCETNDFQIGSVCELKFNLMAQKSFLLLVIYFGNKTQKSMNNFQLKYFADNSKLSMWTNPEQIDSVIPAGQQVKQSLALQFKDPAYQIPIAQYTCNYENRMIEGKIAIPGSLLLYVDLRDVDERIFRSKWRAKKASIIRSSVFQLNTRIIKNGQDFLKYFPKLIELIPYRKFQEQRIEMNKPIRDRKYLNYKLGGVFELSEANSEYMIKIILYPNMLCCIQLISNFEKISVAENLLQTLIFTIALIDQ